MAPIYSEHWTCLTLNKVDNHDDDDNDVVCVKSSNVKLLVKTVYLI